MTGPHLQTCRLCLRPLIWHRVPFEPHRRRLFSEIGRAFLAKDRAYLLLIGAAKRNTLMLGLQSHLCGQVVAEILLEQLLDASVHACASGELCDDLFNLLIERMGWRASPNQAPCGGLSRSQLFCREASAPQRCVTDSARKLPARLHIGREFDVDKRLKKIVRFDGHYLCRKSGPNSCPRPRRAIDRSDRRDGKIRQQAKGRNENNRARARLDPQHVPRSRPHPCRTPDRFPRAPNNAPQTMRSRL